MKLLMLINIKKSIMKNTMMIKKKLRLPMNHYPKVNTKKEIFKKKDQELKVSKEEEVEVASTEAEVNTEEEVIIEEEAEEEVPQEKMLMMMDFK
jgi:hypothetical protein